MKAALKKHLGEAVVIDSASNWVYLGILDQVDEDCIILRDADAHDISDTEASKELYIFDARTNGIKISRTRVYINLISVISFSSLADVKAF